MIRTFSLVLILIISFHADSLHAQATIGGDWRADIENFAQQIVDAGLTPGFGVAVTKGDWVLYSDGFGVADESIGRAIDDETRFYIASSTKALTATAVVQLAEKGKIDLEAPVTRYLPNLQFRPPLDASSISIKDLLTMTDGIEYRSPVVLRTAYTGQFTTDLLIKLLSDYGPAESGKSFDYGNLPYNILGLVLGKVAADSLHPGAWKSVVRQEVLMPLNMAHTSAYRSKLELDQIAMPHEFLPDKSFQRVRLAKDDANLHAAGGHFTTAPNLAKFVAAHASEGLFNGERIFPKQAIAATHKNYVKQDRKFGSFQRVGWGYGWDLANWQDKTVVNRFGGFAGYFSHMSFMPKYEIGVVVLTNGPFISSIGADLLATYIYDKLLGIKNIEKKYAARLEKIQDRLPKQIKGMEKQLAERRKRLEPLPHPLSDYAGIYENSKLGRMEWRVVADGLEVRMGVARSRAEVFKAKENKLRIKLTGGGTIAEFKFPENGGPAQSINWQGYTLRRVE
jgi:CubicO group peptidase (beta-lactamase class C family)